MNTIEHLSENIVAGFVDGRLARADRTAAEAHLAACAACREEVIAVQRIVHPNASPRRFIPIGVAAAAAAIVLAIALPASQRAAPQLVRGGAAVAAVQVNAPVENGVLDTRTGFNWQPVADAVEYRLTITNDAGDVVAERVTSEAAATIAPPKPGVYRWYVTAMRRDGSVLSSRVRTFRMR